MKPATILTLNAFLMVAIGIAVTLYAPNLLAFFQLNDLMTRLAGEESLLQLVYWMIVSFARLFGAGLLGTGILIWSLRTIIADPLLANEKRRGILFSLLLANLIITLTALTQQFSVWGSIIGWVIVGVFVLFSAAYTYAVAKNAP